MGDTGDLPGGLTEHQLAELVRELLGDEDMTDADVRIAYTSGIFQELCPDIEKYAKERAQQQQKNSKIKTETNPLPPQEVKKEKLGGQCGPSHTESKSASSKPDNQASSTIKVKVEKKSESDSDLKVSSRHSHHKKKKKKHKKEHKKDKERDDERKEKDQPKKSYEVKTERKYDSSDSEDERRKHKSDKEKDKHKKKHSRVLNFSSSDSDQSSAKVKVKQEKHHVKESESKVDDFAKGTIKTENDSKAKVHPYYLDKKPVESNLKDVKREEVKNQPKPFSKYNPSVSHINLRRWKPILHRDHFRYQRKFKLKPTSVTCVDLLDLPMIFHNANKRSKNPNSIPLTSGLELSTTRLDMIRRLERDKLSWLRKKLTKQALKCTKHHKRGYGSSDDDKRATKRARIMDRLVSDSDSSDSCIMYPNKQTNKGSTNDRDKGKGKLSKAEKDAEMRRRKIEEIKRKGEKLSTNKTRVLPWENKDEYFKTKKKQEEAAKEKEKAIAEKRKRQEKLRLERLEKEKHKPSVSFQRILAQIDAANKEEDCKPTVQLKIPKLSQQPFRPPTEFKIEKKIGVSDVAKEVSRLLSSNVTVECPVIPDNVDDLGEYTVKKIAWWLLKNEAEPADDIAFHPELHDNDKGDSDEGDEFDWPSDMSSINGCVSDPEGLAAEIKPDPAKINDPDWIDDYCGEASLYARIRRPPVDSNAKVNFESHEGFKTFMRIRPGTNYAKPNFEAKCFVCERNIKGQRQLGAHIRSEHHKNCFRNISLDKANYEERFVKVVPKKVFIAKLVKYSSNVNQSSSNEKEKSDIMEETKENKHHVGKIERIRSDSPGPIIGGDAAGNVELAEMPIPDDLSILSIENYDISSDESLHNVRVVIRTSGKWNDDLERRWRTWRDEEAKITERYNELRDYYINEPERHPSYQEEWMKFWDKRCTELEAEGVDTENYNFQKEWMKLWLERMQELMLEQVEVEVRDLKKSLMIDKHTLRQRFGIPEAVTKRKNIKKKGKVIPNADNASSLKSTDRQDSGYQQVSKPTTNYDIPKSSFLPTPPTTSDEHRNKNFGGNYHRRYSSKSPPCTPLYQNDSSNSNPINPGNDNSVNANSSNDKLRQNNEIPMIKGDSPISSEPPPPGDLHDKTRVAPHPDHVFPDNRKHQDESRIESKSKIDEVDKKSFHRRDDKHDRHHKREKDDHRRRDRDDNRRHDGDHNHRRDKSGHSHSHNRDRDDRHRREKDDRHRRDDRRYEESRKDREDRRRHERRDERRSRDDIRQDANDHSKTKDDELKRRASKDSDHEAKQTKQQDEDVNDNVSSTSSNTKTLQARLRALREALAQEETVSSSNRGQTVRPKVKPVESLVDSTDNSRSSRGDLPKISSRLEDGEVASDISSEDEDFFKPVSTEGVSTFIDNDDLPGFSDAKNDLDTLGKNSFGRHLLERKSSTDQPFPRDNSHPERSSHNPGSFKKKKRRRNKDNPNFPQNDNHKWNRHQGGNQEIHAGNFNTNNNPNLIPVVNNRFGPSVNQSSSGFGPPPPRQEESWDSPSPWETSPRPNFVPPLFPNEPSRMPGPSQSSPFSFQSPSTRPPVPDFGNQIPVVQQQQNFYNNSQIPPNNWGGSWDTTNNSYNPYSTGNYYNR